MGRGGAAAPPGPLTAGGRALVRLAAVLLAALGPARGLCQAPVPVAQGAQLPAPAILPRPDTIAPGPGAFALPARIHVVVAQRSRRLDEIAAYLRRVLAHETGLPVAVERRTPRRGDVAIALDPAAGTGPEAYTLTVVPAGVRIAAPGPEGVLWGVQTLRQLLPARSGGGSAPAGERAGGPARTIAAVTIHDAPRFRWRGSLLDAGRHFFPVPFVERFVDLSSRYKLNVLHWHLTDDQGWRLEIPDWPRLTEVGAWRTEADGTRYGGFYTRREVREVVEYARLRGVTVVPEIEMPGHSVAAIASYPWLGCTGDSIPVANRWGVFPDVYCPLGNTFGFLDDLLSQVVALFPSRYLHVGGDEVPKDRWRACAACQALMRAEGLKDEDALQGWFTGRIGAWLAAHGRRLVGWDEITSAPLPPDAVVEVWRDTATIARVAQQGHDVVAAPGAYTYLDHSPGDLTLARVYAFDPAPASFTPAMAAHILGGEAPLWSERITQTNFDLMAFPRLLAFAEALWTRRPRDLADFRQRLAATEARLGADGVAFGPEDRDVLRMTPVYDSVTGRFTMRVAAGVPGVEVRYTRDGTAPAPGSPLYADSAPLDSAGTARFQGFYRGGALGDGRTITLAPSLARGRPYTLATPPSPRYPGTGPRDLTDGAAGSLDFTDGLWQGWQGADLEATLDLGRATAVAAVEGSFQQTTESWILLPRDFTVWLSDDGATWRPAGTAASDQSPQRMDPFLYRLTVTLPAGAAARWIRVRATNPGPLSAWHPSAGKPSWIFCDEIRVR
ncbi:MAG TPA: family 20 glycosylhydrolase [Gemmatimonadales bacterium]|nr:family 20 glycosylhydrolase [Gemmatimonadales bacterium]